MSPGNRPSQPAPNPLHRTRPRSSKTVPSTTSTFPISCIAEEDRVSQSGSKSRPVPDQPTISQQPDSIAARRHFLQPALLKSESRLPCVPQHGDRVGDIFSDGLRSTIAVQVRQEVVTD